MQGTKDLLDSERGVFCIVLTLASFVFVAIGKMTIDQWIEYTKWIAVTLVASKTVTGVIETYALPQAKAVQLKSVPPAAPPPA